MVYRNRVLLTTLLHTIVSIHLKNSHDYHSYGTKHVTLCMTVYNCTKMWCGSQCCTGFQPMSVSLPVPNCCCYYWYASEQCPFITFSFKSGYGTKHVTTCMCMTVPKCGVVLSVELVFIPCQYPCMYMYVYLIVAAIIGMPVSSVHSSLSVLEVFSYFPLFLFHSIVSM